MLMLYLNAGMPTVAQPSIIFWMCSMSRSRSGDSPSMIAPRFSRSICDEARNGSATMSSATPCDSHRSLVCSRSSCSQ